MVIKEITNREEWENCLLQCAQKTFLQSWDWGEFCAQGASASGGNLGQKIWRFGAFSNNGNVMGAAMATKISAKRATFLFIPHGPVAVEGATASDKKEIVELLMLHLGEIALKEKACFIRVAPIFSRTEENENIFSDLGFRQAPIHMHPEVTWELDITLPEEDLLANMRKTTRYLIRQAEKNPDIQIEISNKIEDLNLFFPVYKETAKRHHFVVFSKEYLEAELKCFLGDRQILMFLGKYKGQVVSAAIFVFWQNMCFYHHSGSLSKFNKFPVSYLLQWRAIQEAKKQGCNTYNFWGIAPDIETEQDAQKSKHPWAGLSLFKMGFGGYKRNYVKTQDIVISNRYWINYIIEKIRKLKRSL